ncbi:MAG: hypothetical protein K2X82_05485 [Gemmataceae bacterium]|nr:hypothetical protein [Gemmataceae bacterium]
MLRHLRLTAVAVMVTLLTGSVSQGAYFITVAPNFVQGAQQYSVLPSGKFSVPAAQNQPAYRVVTDYGTIAGGTFTPFANGAVTAVTAPANGGPANWAQQNANLFGGQPPVNAFVRARLEKFTGFPFGWDQVAEQYASFP